MAISLHCRCWGYLPRKWSEVKRLDLGDSLVNIHRCDYTTTAWLLHNVLNGDIESGREGGGALYKACTLISIGRYDKYKLIYICGETLGYRMCRGGGLYKACTLIYINKYDNYKSIYICGETLGYRMCRGGPNIRPGTLISIIRYDKYKSI